MTVCRALPAGPQLKSQGVQVGLSPEQLPGVECVALAPQLTPSKQHCPVCNVLADTRSHWNPCTHPEGIILPAVQKLRLKQAQGLLHPMATKWQKQVWGNTRVDALTPALTAV